MAQDVFVAGQLRVKVVVGHQRLLVPRRAERVI
jgi:hypothetical protein